MLDILAFGTNIFIWSVLPFISKFLMHKISPFNLSLLRYFFGGMLALILLLIFNKKNSKIYSLDLSFYIVLAIIMIFTFAATNIYYHLLKKFNANYVSVIIYPLMIILTAIIWFSIF